MAERLSCPITVSPLVFTLRKRAKWVLLNHPVGLKELFLVVVVNGVSDDSNYWMEYRV